MAAEFAFRPVRELARRLRTGQTRPVELAEYFLDRLGRFGPAYNALVTLTPERARREAAEAEAELRAGRDRGPLHGIPYGAKDLLAAAGYPTTWGAAPFREQRFDYDATVVRRLREAGAVLVGKLATVELAGGMGYTQPNAAFTGPGKNPWNPEFWSGGSSNGPGSAVAAGLVPFALGTETWGSIITPAAFCGVTGLRPTYGRVSRFGAMPLSWSLDKVGPLALTADDCGLVLSAIAGRDPADPTTVDRPFHWELPDRTEGFRVGVLKGSAEDAQPEVARNFEASLRVLSTFCRLEDVELPDLPFNEMAATILFSEAGSVFEDFITSGRVAELTAPEDRHRPYAYLVVPAKDYLRALRLRKKAVKVLNDLFGGYDAVVSPSRPTVAGRIDQDFRTYLPARTAGLPISAAENVAGLPGVTVPNGFGQNGLPTGIQFTGAAFAEGRILAVAHAYQLRTDWHRRHPAVG